MIPLLAVILIVALGLVAPDVLEQSGNAMFSFITLKFGWGYMLIMISFIAFVVWLGFLSPHKNIKLGDQDAEPLRKR